MSQPILCWCGAAALPAVSGTRPHCSDEHQEIDPHIPFDIAPYATLFREMPDDYQPPSLKCNRAYNSESDSPVADAEKRA